MTILHIVGKPRAGKGIIETFLACYVGDAGTIVDSNYHIWDLTPETNRQCQCSACQRENRNRVVGRNHNCIGFYDLLEFLKKPRQSPLHLLNIDELPGWCDSYVTSSKSSRYATHFLNQSQKLGYDLIFTSQRTMRADINFRELSDARCRAEKNMEKQCFEYHWLNPEETEEDVETGAVTRIPFEMAKDFWGRYDTFEAVPPVGLDEVLVEMEKYDPVRMNRTIDTQVQLLLAKAELTTLAKLIDVKDALLELGEPTCYAPYVHVRLLRRLRMPSIPLQTQTPKQLEEASQLQYSDRWRALRKA